MKRFILRYLLGNRQVATDILIELLRYFADQSDTEVDDELVEQLAAFIQAPVPPVANHRV